LRAQLVSRELPTARSAGGRQSFEVIVRNVGGETWPAVADANGRYAVSLRARWLRTDDVPVNNKEYVARIPFDMEPGDTAGLKLEVSAPDAPGEYVLELFVVQEGVARGAGPLRTKVEVSPIP
jgi:hypothetical protein